jgi:hypothetical protein
VPHLSVIEVDAGPPNPRQYIVVEVVYKAILKEAVVYVIEYPGVVIRLVLCEKLILIPPALVPLKVELVPDCTLSTRGYARRSCERRHLI